MRALFFILLISCGLLSAQDYRYVNVENLALKEYPDTNSGTYILLHAPCKVAVQEIPDRRYKKIPEIMNNWYIVRFFINDGSRLGGRTYKGYVKKEYLVKNLHEVTVAGIDTSVTFSYTIPNDSVRHDLKFFESSGGGCFYINAAGKKEYVNFCR